LVVTASEIETMYSPKLMLPVTSVVCRNEMVGHVLHLANQFVT